MLTKNLNVDVIDQTEYDCPTDTDTPLKFKQPMFFSSAPTKKSSAKKLY